MFVNIFDSLPAAAVHLHINNTAYNSSLSLCFIELDNKDTIVVHQGRTAFHIFNLFYYNFIFVQVTAVSGKAGVESDYLKSLGAVEVRQKH